MLEQLSTTHLVVGALLSVLLPAQVGHSLRMINLDAPQIALLGDTIHLSCLFKLSSSNKQQKTIAQTTANSLHLSEDAQRPRNDDQDDGSASANELLYAIKWYKDGKEFFRYLAQEWPKKQSLPADGIQLDVDKSDNHTIVLRSVNLRTSGLYRCEVSTDAPHFITKSMERRLLVYAIPNEGPAIEVMKPTNNKLLFRGDSVELLCSTPESKPPLSLDWIINDTLNLSSIQHKDNSSATMSGAEVGRLFNFTSSRFVRLPGLQSGSSSMNGRGSPKANSKHILYLVHNGSMASPYQAPGAMAAPAVGAANVETQAKAQVINLTGSLDKLAETSETSLNFTVDAKLSLYLSRLATNQQRTSSQGSRSRGTRQADSVAREIHGSTINRTIMMGTKFRDNPRHQAIGPNNNVTSSRASSRGKSTKAPKASDTVTGSSLRIKCVARMMHLSMSDEIKLDMAVDRARDEVDIRSFSTEMVSKSGSLEQYRPNYAMVTWSITIAVSLLISLS